ncbi:MAG: DUF4190 domain-containing protein [Pirellulaceae bacterium]
MPIETICQTCARRLRVADEFAGKKARCPQCGTIYVVPAQPELAAAELKETIYVPGPDDEDPDHETSDRLAPRGEAPRGEQWQVRTPDHRVYGPVSKSELDQWVAEGRVPAEASVQSTSAAYWRPASEVFPQLRRSAPLDLDTASANPFAEQPFAEQPFAEQPFAEQPGASPFAGRAVPHVRPHRGVLILIFAFLGWLACPIFAPVAWIMGQSDLRDMRRGLMDSSGMSLTQAGMILGMIETILALLFMAAMCLGGMA